MKRPVQLDRRRFVQVMGGASLLGAVGVPLNWAASGISARPARFAYIGGEQGIHVYSIAGGERFIERQRVASAHSVAMAISDRNLYVANGVSEYRGRPRGTVEAYAIDPRTGTLEFRNRVPLSLSAILPRGLAIAPGGRSLVVAVHGGGAYNVVSIGEDGRLGRVTGILKETGSGPHELQARAHPSAVVFDRAGRVLTADQGSDRLNVFTLGDGELTVAGRCEVTEGSGPSSMVLDADNQRLYVAQALDGTVSTFGYDATDGRILQRQQTIRISNPGEKALLAMHPSRETMYSSHGDGVQAWKIATNGSLMALSAMEGLQTRALRVMPDGNNLLALSSDSVLKMKIDATTGVLAAPVRVASVLKPASIALV